MPAQDIGVGYFVTDTGAAKVLEALANETKLEITKVAVGNGGNLDERWNYSLENLVNPVFERDFDEEKDVCRPDLNDDKQLYIETTFCSNELEADFINEVGFFDAKNNLIIYGLFRNLTVDGAGSDNFYFQLQNYIRLENRELETIVVSIAQQGYQQLRNDFEDLKGELESMLKNVKIDSITEPEILEILDMDFDFSDTIVVGEAMSPEDVDLFLDDDPDNDPDYSGDSRVGALSDEEIDAILKD